MQILPKNWLRPGQSSKDGQPSRFARLRSRRSVVATIVLIPVFGSAFMLQQSETVASARLLDQVLQLTATRFVDTVSPNELYEKAARGLVRELNDPYSVLFSPKELDQFTLQTGGKYGGVGMEIAEIQGYVTVQRVFPHTPAAAGGVQEGDKIVQIDTFNARGWTTQQVSDKLKGEPGTKVSVKFGRSGVTEQIPVTFTRAIVHIPAVPYALVFEGNIGYVLLQQFSETATDELSEGIKDVISRGATKLIVDLRSNPGGILDEAIASSNLFLKQGVEVASVRGRTGPAQIFEAEKEPTYPTIPTIVLVDGRSASASEILAGSLQDHDRALIVGTTSFGKGLVQSLFNLDGGYALKMTTAKWFTPSGRSIQKDRKLLPDGEFVEVAPDSMESDSAKHARPKFKSDAGRIVYGGGGITPDIVVKPDTLSTAEQKLFTSLAPKQQVVLSQLQGYSAELKGKIKPDFEVKGAIRTEILRRFRANGVILEDSLLTAGERGFDNFIGARIASSVFGDSTAKRKYLSDDNQLIRAIELLKKVNNQDMLFTNAKKENSAVATRAVTK